MTTKTQEIDALYCGAKMSDAFIELYSMAGGAPFLESEPRMSSIIDYVMHAVAEGLNAVRELENKETELENKETELEELRDDNDELIEKIDELKEDCKTHEADYEEISRDASTMADALHKWGGCDDAKVNAAMAKY